MEILDINSKVLQDLFAHLGIDPNKVLSFELQVTRQNPATVNVRYFVPTADVDDFFAGLKRYKLVSTSKSGGSL